MKVSDQIAQELLRREVKYVFTVPGGFSMHLNDSIHYSGPTPIYMLHESAAALAAAAWAQFTGRIGVCCLTAGPGCTNAMTGVASAWMDGLPLLVISGDARTGNLEMRDKYKLRQAGPQDVDIYKMVRSQVKYAGTAGNPEHTDWLLNTCFREALEPRRGPVWMIVPLDVQEMESK
jgi:acetolactate synthase-1/2/3 large subunit